MSERVLFAERLSSGAPIVGDGAIGTMLFERGLATGACPESVTLDHPEWLVEIAESYLRAGAEILTTNTFGGSDLKLVPYGLQDRYEEINRRGVELLREVAGKRAYVAGSMGPTGKLIKPYGDTDTEVIEASFLRQAETLIAAGVDCVFVETMMDLAEATVAVRAVKQLSPSTPVAVSMTFDATSSGFFTIMGVSVDAAASGLTDAGADAVGSNCGNGSETMVEIARAFRAATDLPLIIQSNAGLPQVVDGKTTYPETPAYMAQQARELLALGVAIVGGCCGTTPEHIREIGRAVGR